MPLNKHPDLKTKSTLQLFYVRSYVTELQENKAPPFALRNFTTRVVNEGQTCRNLYMCRSSIKESHNFLRVACHSTPKSPIKYTALNKNTIHLLASA